LWFATRAVDDAARQPPCVDALPAIANAPKQEYYCKSLNGLTIKA